MRGWWIYIQLLQRTEEKIVGAVNLLESVIKYKYLGIGIDK